MNWTIATDIAERIKDLRKVLQSKPDKKLPQEELGMRAGVRPSQVSQWERGVQQPSRSRLERWAEREGWPVDIFAEGGPKPSEVLSPTVNGTPAESDSGNYGIPPESLDPDDILARFYRLMAAAAERGRPWPPELARLMHDMYRAAKPVAISGNDAAGARADTRIPGW